MAGRGRSRRRARGRFAAAPSLAAAVCKVSLSLLCVCWPGGRPARGLVASDPSAANAQRARAADGPSRALREGRDFIERENWGRAAETFERFIDTYAGDENVDEALYWLAYVLKKQAKYAEAERRLERLRRDYPRSTWGADAEAMRVEMAPFLGQRRLIEEALASDDEALRLVALQGLFQTDPAAASRHVESLLGPDSPSSAQHRQAVVALLGRVGGEQAVALLLGVARGQADVRLRRAAIVSLGQIGDERTLDYLKEQTGDANPDITEAALYAISRQGGARAVLVLGEVARSAAPLPVRREAVTWLRRRDSDASAGELIKIYDAEADAGLKREALLALSQMDAPSARAKLAEVARASDSVEERKQAIFWLGRRADEQSAVLLSELYDAEQGAEVKERILFVLAQSRSRRATQKLLDVARGDASAEMRRKALAWLARSPDPEAKRFSKGSKAAGEQ
ncbi:MAG TPA: HEAT repeat domain-containing protein [Pyrinomonadaceae bacterium]